MSADFVRGLGVTVQQTARTSAHRGALVVAASDVPKLHAALAKLLARWVS